MNMPGFSADSLYRTSVSYQLVPLSLSVDGAGAQVAPSLIFPTWCGPCLPNGLHYCCSAVPRTGSACWWSFCIPPGGGGGGGGLVPGDGSSGITMT